MGDEHHKGFTRWLAERVALYFMAATVIYFIGRMFNIIPQPITDMIVWFDHNFFTIVVFVCFILVFYLIMTYLKMKKKGA